MSGLHLVIATLLLLSSTLLAHSGTLIGNDPRISPEATLARARQHLLNAVSQLPKYTCTQTVNRRYFTRTAPVNLKSATCDHVLGDVRRGAAKFDYAGMDRLRLDVAISSSGREIYSWSGDRRMEIEDVNRLAGGGPFGTGPFGPFIINIFGTPGIAMEYIGERRQGSTPQTVDGWLEYRYKVPVLQSNYQLRYGTRPGIIPFGGAFWLDSATSDLKRLIVRTAELPPRTGACEATTTIEFSRVQLGRQTFLLPLHSKQRFVMRNGDEMEYDAANSNCHEYVGESVLRFDDAVEPTNSSSAAAKPAGSQSLPPDTEVQLRLETAIDTATAAAGDPVMARLVRAVSIKRPRGEYLRAAPAGALVRGRIIRLEHYAESSRFLIALQFDTIEINGTTLPFSAKLAGRVTNTLLGFRQFNLRTAASATGAFVFKSETGHYVIPQGHESTWVTLPIVQPPTAR